MQPIYSTPVIVMDHQGTHEWSPLLEPGIHPMTFQELHDLCAKQFEATSNRAKLLEGLCGFLDRLSFPNVETTVWIDGSFLTRKYNPNDVDLVLHASASEYDNNAEYKLAMDWAIGDEPRAMFGCHSFVMFPNSDILSEVDWRYWLNRFGFGRNDVPKGIASLQINRRPRSL